MRIATVSILILISILTFGQSDKYYVETIVGNSQPKVGEQFRVDYKLKYKGSSISLVNPVYNIDPPSFEGFEVVDEGKVGGFNFEWGGDITVYNYAYILVPLDDGTKVIDPVTMSLNGKSYESDAVEIYVGESSTPYAPANSNAKSNEKYFIKCYTNKSKAFVGEQLTVTYKMYSRSRYAGDFIPKNDPSFAGFWKNDIDLKNVSVEQEKIGNKTYNTAVIKQAVLFPQASGSYEIEPLQIQTYVEEYKNWYGLKIPELVELNLSSNAITLEILPLPLEGKPAEFSGAVGDFNIEVGVSPAEVEVGQQANVKVTLSGTGNIHLASIPGLDLPEDLYSFDPGEQNNVSVGFSQTTGNRVVDYIVEPTAPGQHKIPPLAFSYYDIENEEYKIIYSDEQVIVASGDAQENPTTISGVSKKDIEELGSDIRYIKTKGPNFTDPQNKFLGSPLFYSTFSLPVVLWAFLFLMVRRRDKMAGDVVGSKKRGARKQAQKRLSQASKHLKSNEDRAFYDEVVRAVWGYLADKVGLNRAELSKDNIHEQLEKRNVPEESIKELMSILQDCEMALFAPGNVEEKMKSTYERALEIISKLEGWL